MSLFSPPWCHSNLCSRSVDGACRMNQQHHLVEVGGKLTRQQTGLMQGQPQYRGTCGTQLCFPKTTTTVFIKTLAAVQFWGCIRVDMMAGSTRTGLPLSLETSTIHYPLLLWPTFDLWSLSRRQCFLGLTHLLFFFLSFFFLHVSYFTASSFSCCARQQWGLDCCMVRCDSSNTLWFIKDILLASRGKKIPNQLAVAPVCPLNPHWPDHISAEAGNHRMTVVNQTHNTISICHFFPAQCSIVGTVLSVAPGCR